MAGGTSKGSVGVVFVTHTNFIEIFGSPGLIFHHSELLHNSCNVDLKTKGQCCVGRGSEMWASTHSTLRISLPGG